MKDTPTEYSEKEIQDLMDDGELDVPSCPGRSYPCNPVYFYTDLENDDFPSLFTKYSHHPGKSDIHYDIAKKAFEIVLAGLS